jgi:hypothetical protein
MAASFSSTLLLLNTWIMPAHELHPHNLGFYIHVP